METNLYNRLGLFTFTITNSSRIGVKNPHVDEEYFENQPDTRFLSQLSKEEHQHIVNLRMIPEENRTSIMEETAKIVKS